MEASLSEKNAAPSALLWTVLDRNAKAAPRTHEAPSGKLYALTAQGPGTPMPQSDAMVFLRDPSFEVFDADGNRQSSLPDSENLDALKARPKLEPGETIAKLEELLTTALQARCAVRPNGHVLATSKDRKAMVAFLMDAPTIAELPVAERARQTGTREADEMSDDVAKKMLAGDPLAMGG